MNHEERTVISGAWDVVSTPTSRVVLKDEWEYANGRKQPAFPEAKEYARLVLEEGYQFFTFPMGQKPLDIMNESETVRIDGFEPRLDKCRLVYDKGTYIAFIEEADFLYADELNGNRGSDQEFTEGNRRTILVNAVERNARARAECIALNGLSCSVCDFNFEATYGDIGIGFIHVHHVNLVSSTSGARTVDPASDLVPVCPNCHAMLHKRTPPFSIDEMKQHLASRSVKS